MQPEYLQAHTCSHCEDIVLPGKPLDGRVSCIGKWWEPIEAMAFVNPCHVDGICHLGLSVADLQRKANAGCSFAEALWYRMREKLDRELDLDRLLFCTNKHHYFEVLLRLSERLSARDGAAGYVSTDPGEFLGIMMNGISGKQTPEPSECDCCYLSLLFSSNFMDGHGSDFHLTAENSTNNYNSVKNVRPIAADPLSERTLLSIQNWLEDCERSCLSTHKLCSISERAFVPTRLIEITTSASGSGLQLRLVSGLSTQRKTYAALSYCWGGPQPTRLSQDNIESYQKSITWHDLPATIRDAVEATHRLGVQYLWVDSLCIVQDGLDDEKATEIGLMAKIYTHAKFTIMVRRGKGANEGFLQRRTLPFGTSRLSLESETNKFVNLTYEAALEIDGKATLDTRGWATQEYVLSRRVIMFGSWQTSWSCRTERHLHNDGWDPNLPALKRDPFYEKYTSNTWPFAADLENAAEIREVHGTEAVMFFSANPNASQNHWPVQPSDQFIAARWRWIVTTYTSRSFTEAKDRAVAVAGIAERFAPFISKSQRYIAGLWESNMPAELLYCNVGDVLLDRSTEYHGPSWSWVSIQGPVITATRCNCPVKVHSIEFSLENHVARFGAVCNAVLSMEGPVMSVEWKPYKHNTNEHPVRTSQCRWRKAGIEGGDFLRVRLAITPDAREYNLEWQEAILVAFNHDEKTPGLAASNGIILVQTKEDRSLSQRQKTYRRLGFWGLGSYASYRTLRENWEHNSPTPPPDEWPIQVFVVV